ncbi:MAG: AEC family transporter [Pseudomonadales bacterium]
MTSLSFIDQLNFALAITGPAFLVILLGQLLYRYQVISDGFTQGASAIVFNVALPATLFLNVARADLSLLGNGSHLAIAIAVTFAIVGLSWLACRIWISSKAERGVVIHASYRGNMAVIGLAFCEAAYGPEGLALAAIPVGILTALYNVLAVWILSTHIKGSQNKQRHWLSIMARNPLLLSIVAGFIANSTGLPLPTLILDTGSYFSQLTFPLALLCIGASINLRHMRLRSAPVVIVTCMKLIVAPAVMVTALYLGGIRGTMLGIFFLLTATPTAAASYIMVQAMGGDGRLAANVIVVSSVLSALTITLGLLILRSTGLI